MPSPAMMEQEELVNAIIRSRPVSKRTTVLTECSTAAIEAAAIARTQNRLLSQLKHIENTFSITSKPLA